MTAGDKTAPLILITGANGFIGGNVCKSLASTWDVRAVVREVSTENSPAGKEVVHGDLSADFDWSRHLKDVSVVIHCAARVHVLKETSLDPLADFRAVNVSGTMNLARQAADAGVGRFIFLSSIGVNGLETGTQPFRARDPVSPNSDYAVSKREAEKALLALSARTAMEVVIIRPPLVYGPHAPGNFFTLANWINQGIPLPLGALTQNRRSFLYVQNLIDLIEICLDHPAAANEVFLASDGEDISTTDLLIRIAKSMGRPTRLIPLPAGVLYAVLSLFGKSRMAQSLCRSLQIDIQKTRDMLGWAPSASVDEGLHEVAMHWVKPDSHSSK